MASTTPTEPLTPAAAGATVERAPTPRTVTVTDTPPGGWRSLRDAWRYRELTPKLGTRVLVKLIWGTKLGWSWLVLRPLMDTLGKALIFGAILGVAAPGGLPYFVFLIAGLIAWRLFDRIVLYATRSFDFYRKTMTNLDFPLLLVPIASAAFPAVEISVYVAVFLGSILFYLALQGQFFLELGVQSFAALGGLAILVSAGLGIGFWTSVLNGKARDTRLIIRYVLEFWLYLTPIVYPLTAIPPAYQKIAALNPMTAPVEMVKLGLVGVGNVNLYAAIWSVAFAVLAVVSGLWFFGREARRSVDIHGPGGDEEEEEERDEL